MERLHLLDMVARIRLAANDCERLILAQKETVRALRLSGQTDGEEETKLPEAPFLTRLTPFACHNWFVGG